MSTTARRSSDPFVHSPLRVQNKHVLANVGLGVQLQAALRVRVKLTVESQNCSQPLLISVAFEARLWGALQPLLSLARVCSALASDGCRSCRSGLNPPRPPARRLGVSSSALPPTPPPPTPLPSCLPFLPAPVPCPLPSLAQVTGEEAVGAVETPQALGFCCGHAPTLPTCVPCPLPLSSRGGRRSVKIIVQAAPARCLSPELLGQWNKHT